MTGAFGISEERWEAVLEEVAAVAEDNRRREEREAIEARRLIWVSWTDCTCDYSSKYCDEYHRVGAYVPATVLNTYRDKRSEW